LYLEITTPFVTRQTNVGYNLLCMFNVLMQKMQLYCTSVGTTFCAHGLELFL